MKPNQTNKQTNENNFLTSPNLFLFHVICAVFIEMYNLFKARNFSNQHMWRYLEVNMTGRCGDE